MTLTKSLLLGSAAGVLATSGASAADLPPRSKGPAVEYVRICDTYGAGYFYIPGTDTCLKISGYARADYAVRNVQNRFGSTGGTGLGGVFVGPLPVAPPVLGLLGNADNAALSAIIGVSAAARDSVGFGGLGGLELDARSQTAWGTLRGFIRYELATASGVLGSGVLGNGVLGNGIPLDKAFVQFAGITAGRAQSFFTFYGDAYPLDFSRGEDSTTHLLAYTASFGGGFSGTVSIEDPTVRRGGIGKGSLFTNAGVGTPWVRNDQTATYGGEKLPDVVAQLRVDQAWGKAQISGAVHQINTIAGPAISAFKASGTGWAVQAGIAINLPSLAAGDEVYLQGGYAVGAKSYLGIGGNLGQTTNGLQRNDVDAVAIARLNGVGAVVGYGLEKGRGWNVQGGIKHYWAPNFVQKLWASYTQWSYGGASGADNWDQGGFSRGRELLIGTGVTWTPVKNLDLTLDAQYAHLNNALTTGNFRFNLAGANQVGVVAPVGFKTSGSSFTGRLRIQRSF